MLRLGHGEGELEAKRFPQVCVVAISAQLVSVGLATQQCGGCVFRRCSVRRSRHRCALKKRATWRSCCRGCRQRCSSWVELELNILVWELRSELPVRSYCARLALLERPGCLSVFFSSARNSRWHRNERYCHVFLASSPRPPPAAPARRASPHTNLNKRAASTWALHPSLHLRSRANPTLVHLRVRAQCIRLRAAIALLEYYAPHGKANCSRRQLEESLSSSTIQPA